MSVMNDDDEDEGEKNVNTIFSYLIHHAGIIIMLCKILYRRLHNNLGR